MAAPFEIVRKPEYELVKIGVEDHIKNDKQKSFPSDH